MSIYIDVGFYAGVALKKYQDEGIVDDSWTVYAFEANPQLKVPKWVSRKAAWIKDGKVTLLISGREDSASVQGTSGHTTPQKVKVPSIDFSKFVAKLPDVYTICSMDIEGAEFRVLKKMLKDKTIDKINLLDIEFHHRLMKDYDSEDAKKLVKQIRYRGVKVKLKVGLV